MSFAFGLFFKKPLAECLYLNLVAGDGFRCITVMYGDGGGGCYHDCFAFLSAQRRQGGVFFFFFV